MTHVTGTQDVVHSPYTPATGRARLIVSLSGLLVLAATHGWAQDKPGTVSGVVIDPAGAPIPNVEVTALKLAKVVRSDSVGEFVIAVPAGTQELSFRRLAYEPIVLRVAVPPGDTTDIEVTLDVVAQRLTGVVVQAHAEQVRFLQAFAARRRHGIGHFITRAEIEQRRPLLLSDMLRMIPGAVVSVGNNGRTALRFSRVGSNTCPPLYFVDGMYLAGYSIDDMPPGDVEGVELYAGPAGVPPEFNRAVTMPGCGAVIIWTRLPGSDRRKP
jgi:hypothetical protein